jgi:L-threonylcarbamoyladenylate synthase
MATTEQRVRALSLTGTGDAAVIAEAVTALEQGGLVVVPTETVYGLVADPRLPGAIESIYEAKQRDRGKPLQMLVTGVDVIEKLGFELSGVERRIAESFWPGGITMIVESQGRTEGFRVPESPEVLAIAERVGGALRATSANLSGDPPALTADEAIATLGDSVSIVIDGGPVKHGVASTVLRVHTDESIEVLREGTVSRDALSSVGRLHV